MLRHPRDRHGVTAGFVAGGEDDEDIERSHVAGENLADAASKSRGCCPGLAYNPDMNEQAKKATKRTRRWLKVSLRTFLLAVTVPQ